MMKIFFILFLCLCLAKKQADKWEENNSFKKAAGINISQKIFAKISKKDIDFFTFTLPQTHTVKITLSITREDFMPTLRCYDENLKEIFSLFALTVTNKLSRMENLKGKIYLEISPPIWQDKEIDYQLVIEKMGEVDEFEPNNEKKQATKITIDKKITANIYPLGDIDYFFIENQTNQIKVYQIECISHDLVDVFYIDREKQEKKPMCFKIDLKPQKSAFFLVKSEKLATYTLSAKELAFKKDKFEENNDIFSSKSLEINSQIDATCFPPTDKDFYTIENKSKNKIPVNIHLKNLNPLFLPSIIVYTPEKEVFLREESYKEGEDIFIELEIEPESCYYLSVASALKDLYSIGEYNLKIESNITQEDGFEPNFSFDLAKTITKDKYIEANFHYPKDVDCYKVSLKRGEIFSIKVENQSTFTCLSITLYDDRERIITEKRAKTVGADITHSHYIPYDGEFYLEIKQLARYTQVQPAPYRFIVKEEK